MAAAIPWVSIFLGVYGILWEMNSGVKTNTLTHEEAQAVKKPIPHLQRSPDRAESPGRHPHSRGARCPVCPTVGLDPSVHAIIIAHPEGEEKVREMAMGGFMNQIREPFPLANPLARTWSCGNT